MLDEWAARDDLYLVGHVGLTLYATFFAISLYRTLAVLPLVEWKHPKVAFHCSFTLSFFMESLYFLGFSLEGRFTLWSYSFHIIGLLFYMLGYSAVIFLWAETLTFGGKRNQVPKYCIIFMIGLHAVAAVIEIGGLIASDGYDDFVDSYPAISVVFLVVHSSTLLLLTIGMLIYGIKLQRNLNANTMWLQSDKSIKLMILAKINILLVVCTICYILRLVTLAVLFIDMVFGDENTDDFPVLGWYILSQFLPTLVPACLLLHFMRVKECPRMSSYSDTKGGQSKYSSQRPRQPDDDMDERDSEFSMRDSCKSNNSDTSDFQQGIKSPYKSRFPSDINRISLTSEASSDFCIETESPLEHDRVM